MNIEECVPPTFNVATTSGYYAAMAGVLAGFAFTAIVMLLTPTQVEERRSRQRTEGGDVFLTFLAAFVALIVATLTYSVLAGEDIGSARGRAASQELVDGLPFGLAVIMVFHGLTLLMAPGLAGRLAVWTARAVTGVAAPTLTLFYLANGVSDTEAARSALSAGQCPAMLPYRVGLVLTAAIAVLLTVSLVVRKRRPEWIQWTKSWQDAAPITVVALSVIAALWAGDLSTREPNFLLSPFWLYVYIGTAWLILTTIGIMLLAAYPPSQGGGSPDGAPGPSSQ